MNLVKPASPLNRSFCLGRQPVGLEKFHCSMHCSIQLMYRISVVVKNTKHGRVSNSMLGINIGNVIPF